MRRKRPGRRPAVRLRSVVFWMHLPAGIAAGLLVLVMSLTGTLLAFEKQITAWADGAARVSEPPQGADRLPVADILAAADDASLPATASALTLRADPRASAEIAFGREATLFVDPYTGRPKGLGSRGAREFFHVVTDWHRWLGAHGESRDTARALTGAANLVFLFIVVSGAYLWWPRRWTRGAVASVSVFQRGLRGRARDFNWHNVLGLWSSLPLFFIVLTGVLISYPWATDLLYRATGSEPPPARGSGAGRGPAGSRPGDPERTAPPRLDGLEGMWAAAEARVPGWQSITLRLPRTEDDPLTLSIDESSGAVRPDKRSQLTFDRATGAVVRFETYAEQSRGRQLRTWARWVHTGEAAGVIGQAVAGVASGGAVVLVWTGLALSWRRLRAWLARRRAVTEAAAADRGPAPAFRVSSGDGAES